MDSLDARSVKGAFPFRIGVTSRCGGDGLIRSLERWRWRVDDFLVHLPPGVDLPSEDEIERLRSLGREALSSFTTQLPHDLRLADANADRRRRDAAIAAAAVSRMRPLEPRCYVLALEPAPTQETEDEWREAASASISEIVSATGVPAGFLALENGAYDFALAAKLLAKFGLSACTDVAALYLNGHDIRTHLVDNLFRSRTVHLHMGRDGQVNVPLSAVPVDHLVGFFSYLFQRHFQSVVTIEVLSESDFEASLRAIERAWDRLRQER